VLASLLLYAPWVFDAFAATITISNLPAASTLTGSENVAIDQGSCSTCTVRTTTGAIAALAGANTTSIINALSTASPSQLAPLASAIFAAVPPTAMGALYEAWIATLPVYSGSGEPPVSTGGWYSDGGIPLQAQ
jgi:hypothetical protein